MVTVSTLSGTVETARRLFVVVELTTEWVGLTLLIVGLIGYTTAVSQPTRRARYRGLVVGAVVVLVTASTLDVLHAVVDYVVGGSGLLPPGWPYGSDLGELVGVAWLLSDILEWVAVSCVAAGSALWGAGSPGSHLRRRGRRGVTLGLLMLVVSGGGLVFATLAGVVGL